MKNDLTQTMRIDIGAPSGAADDVGRACAWGPDAPPIAGQTAIRQGGAYDRSPDYRRLLVSIYDGILITSREGMIVDFNGRACDLLGCEPRHLRGANVVELVAGADQGLLDSIHRNLEDHRYTLIEARCRKYDHSLFPAEIAVNRVALDDQSELCFMVRDITVRRAAQDALEDAIARLEAHDRARSQFVSNVSHDLRTPLTSMIYAVQNMLRGVVGALPDGVRRYLEMLEGDCKRLLNTVNDILDIRKIETRSLTLARAKVALGVLVADSAEALRVQADRKGIRLVVDIGTVRRFACCDPQKMERVIQNIVGNAIKFTPEGGTVDVTIVDDPDRTRHALIVVRDTGIGIPPEAISKVTLRYFTVGEQPSGSGLGLAIAREIVELHGGSLQISSPPPGATRGTQVSVALPLADPPVLLVVDDDARIVHLLQTQFEGQGYRVATAATGAEGWDAIRRERPDVLLLDIRLTDMEGTELILKLKSDKQLMRMPAIVITGIDVDRAKGQILQTFGIPVFGKPWDEAALTTAVARTFLGHRTSARGPTGGKSK